MHNAIKIGFFGTGWIASVHRRVLLARNDVEITAVCSRIIDRACKFMNNNTAVRYYTDFDEMIAKEPLDVLYICLPPHAHTGQFEKAAAKGIHIFMEKPIANSRKRAESMVKAARKNKITAFVGYMMRFGQVIDKLKYMSATDSLNKPVLFQARYFAHMYGDHKNWWIDPDLGRGQVFEQIIHLYDLAYFLFGKIDEVFAFTNNCCHNYGSYKIEDVSTATLKFQNGALGSIIGTTSAIPDEWDTQFSIVYSNCTVHGKNADIGEIVNTAIKPVSREVFLDQKNLYTRETSAFIDVITGKIKNPAPLEDGLEGIKIVEAVLKSAKNHKPVKVR